MAERYEELYYHFVWATKDRAPYIDGALAETLYSYLNLLCREMEVEVVAMNGMPDHIHLACSIPTRLSITEVIKALKGKSAYFINHSEREDKFLAWQAGYGALTISKSHLKVIAEYIRNQRQHHCSGTLKPKLERTILTVASECPEDNPQ